MFYLTFISPDIPASIRKIGNGVLRSKFRKTFKVQLILNLLDPKSARDFQILELSESGIRKKIHRIKINVFESRNDALKFEGSNFRLASKLNS